MKIYTFDSYFCHTIEHLNENKYEILKAYKYKIENHNSINSGPPQQSLVKESSSEI